VELKLHVAASLFAIGEYGYAADYLRVATGGRPELLLRPFPLARMYSAAPVGQDDLARHVSALEAWADVRRDDADALWTLAFVQGNLGRSADALLTISALAELEELAPTSPNGAAESTPALESVDPIGIQLASALD
jgi:hypothetical protein